MGSNVGVATVTVQGALHRAVTANKRVQAMIGPCPLSLAQQIVEDGVKRLSLTHGSQSLTADDGL